jgi:hypothetical protein
MKDLKVNVQKIERLEKEDGSKKKGGSKQHKLKNFKDWQVNESRPTNPCVQSIWD